MKRSFSSITGVMLVISIAAFISTTRACNTTKRAKPCNECPQFSQQLDSLKKKIRIDSMTLDMQNKDYYELWEENQIFSSMLAEIENEPYGPEILKKLWTNK